MNKPLAQEAVKRLRTAGLVLPRAPRPGERWAPRTDAEQHLLREAQRLDQVRQVLLAELGRLRGATGHGTGAQAREDMAREAERLKGCPLSATLLAAVEAAASGETIQATARRLRVSGSTVKGQRQRAQARLGVHTVASAVAVCVEAGWINAGPVTDADG